MFFNKNNKYKAGIEKCSCNNNAEQCDLVFELRKLQEEANRKRSLIEYYKKRKENSLIDVLRFIQNFENRAYERYGVRLLGDCYDFRLSTSFINDVMCSYSTEAINQICDSIKAIKDCTADIIDIQEKLSITEDDIQNIKNKLGIE